MIRIILSIILIVLLVVFVSMNVKFTTTLNLFGRTAEQVHTVVVVLLSFVLGILFSFIIYFMSYLTRRRKARLTAREEIIRMDRQETTKKKGKTDRIDEQPVTDLDEEEEQENQGHEKDRQNRHGSRFFSLFRKSKKGS